MLRVVVAVLLVSRVVAANPLSAEDLARKKERGYFTGAPLAAYSVDFGFGAGARVYYYWNGLRSDPRFATSPYLHRVFLQAFATTGGVQFHWLDYDAPHFLDTDYRLRGQLVYARNKDNNYFANAPKLSFPGAAGTFDSYNDYLAAEEQIDGSGITYTRYDLVDVLRPSLLLGVERSLAHERVRLIAGLSLAYAKVRDYSGKRVRAVDGTGMETTAVEAPTRFKEDCDAGKLVGCAGGLDNYLRLGIAYDTRDYEPDPNNGIFADAELDLGTVALGSKYDYVRGMLAARGYYSPIPDHADLVLAGRVFGMWQSSGTPFFTMDIVPFTEDPRFGLGGHRTLRGFRQDRFVEHVMSAVTGEVRWTFTRFRIKGQQFALIAAPFVDVGRAWSALDEVSLKGWHPTAGGALRVSWNLATIVTFDYGVSAEGTGFYVNFGHIF